MLACLVQRIQSLHQSESTTFFLARDAYLPWQLSSELGPYVAVSRQSLRLPLLTRDPQRAIRWTFDRVTVNSVASVIARWGISLDRCRDLLENSGFSPHDWHKPLRRNESSHFKKFLVSHDFLDVADQELRPLMNLTMQYLQDCGLLNENGGTIVDVGWNGSCHQHLQDYRALAGVSPSALGGIYVGLQQRDGFAPGTALHALWEPGNTGAHLFSIDAFYILTELFLTANHGGVIGYRSTDQGVQPILAPFDEEEKLKEWGLEQFQSRMLERAAARLSDASTNWHELTEQTAVKFAELALRPTREEACKIGAWPTCVDPAHQQAHALAPPMDIASMWDYFLYRKPQPVLWRAGVAAQLDGVEKIVFHGACAVDQSLCRFKAQIANMLKRNGRG